MSELTSGHKSILRLIARSEPAAADGWCKVARHIWPLIASIPSELVETRPTEAGGFVRLSEKGRVVLEYLA